MQCPIFCNHLWPSALLLSVLFVNSLSTKKGLRCGSTTKMLFPGVPALLLDGGTAAPKFGHIASLPTKSVRSFHFMELLSLSWGTICEDKQGSK